jgi:hypothetical protein
MEALDIKKTLGEGSVGVVPLFQQIVRSLLMLQEPALNCRAWIVQLNGSGVPKPLHSHSFMVYAATQDEAAQHIWTIMAAMEPGTPPAGRSVALWQPAPQHQQPDGPVRPGIQTVMG